MAGPIETTTWSTSAAGSKLTVDARLILVLGSIRLSLIDQLWSGMRATGCEALPGKFAVKTKIGDRLTPPQEVDPLLC
jgi:hypothetical protein